MAGPNGAQRRTNAEPKMKSDDASAAGEQPSFIQTVQDGMLLRLKVIPGASRSQIVGIQGDRLKIKVTAAPEQGKANRAVVALLQQWLGTHAVEIIAGQGHAEKTAKVIGLFTLDTRRIAALN